MAYRVVVAPAAERAFHKLPKELRKRIIQRVEALAANPRPANSKKLKGDEDFYRVRVGDWRIVYQIEKQRLVVLVVRIGHRRDVYR